MNIFEQATKQALRFETTAAATLLTVEDLWTLPLASGRISLDSVAKAVNKLLKETQEESFVAPSSADNTQLSLKMEVVKYIISVRLKEKEEATNAAAKKMEQEKIKQLIHNKKNEALGEKSIEELEAMLK